MKHRLKSLRDTDLLHHPALPKPCLAILNSVIPKIPTDAATLKVLYRRQWYRCFHFKKQKRNETREKQLDSTTQQRQGKGWEDGWPSQCPVWHVWHYDILQSKDLLCYFRSESQMCHGLITFPWCRRKALYCINLPQGALCTLVLH